MEQYQILKQIEDYRKTLANGKTSMFGRMFINRRIRKLKHRLEATS